MSETKQPSEQVASLAKTVAELKQGQQQKTTVACYRLICPECIEPINVPRADVHQQTGIGAGRDFDGGYDYGFSRTSFMCPKCKIEVTLSGVISEHVGKTMFKVSC